MPVELVLAGAAGGKSTYARQRILDSRRESPHQRVWVITASRFQVEAFQRKLARSGRSSGGMMGATVQTFYGLYDEILRRGALYYRPLSEPLMFDLVRAAIKDAAEAGELRHYLPVCHLPGFIKIARGRINEFKRALLTPTELLEAVNEDEKLRELAIIYQSLQKRLEACQAEERDGFVFPVIELLREHPDLLGDISLVVVDGFDQFTPAQFRLLELIAGQVPDLLITLTGSEDGARQAHQRFEEARRNLQKTLQPEIKYLPKNRGSAPALLRLEANLFKNSKKKVSASGQVEMLELRGARFEAREALRWFKKLILRRGVKPWECALILPQYEQYRPYLRAAAAEFGLPLSFSQPEKLGQQPAAAALFGLLHLPREFERRSLFDLLRSPFFDLSSFQLEPSDAPLLELICRQMQVMDGKGEWAEAFEILISRRSDERDALEDQRGEEEARFLELPEGAAAAALWGGLSAFFERLSVSQKEEPLEHWVNWLRLLLNDLGFLSNAEELEYCLESLLEEMLQSEDLLGERKSNYSAFTELFREQMLACPLRDTSLSSGDILILSPLEARGLHFKAAALVGLSEGLFPRVERADAFISEDWRNRLGLDGRMNSGQASLFYQCVTRAERFLLLTRPAMGENGEEWQPSPYWRRTAELFEEEPRVLRSGEAQTLSDAASLEEKLFWLALGQGKSEDLNHEEKEGWDDLNPSLRVLRERMRPVPEGVYAGYPEDLREELSARYGKEYVWSATQMETYSTCPFRFYIEQVLKLQPLQLPEPGPDMAVVGSLLHSILEDVFLSVPMDQRGNLELLLERLEPVMERQFAEAPRRYGFRSSPFWEMQQEDFKAKLRESLKELINNSHSWTPRYFEVAFGRGKQPDLQIEDGKGSWIKLRGLVDRVDESPNGALRIVDYKTGSSHTGATDLLNRRRLQLPLYSLAVERTLGFGEVNEALYWLILSGKASSLKLSKFEHANLQGVAGSYLWIEQVVREIVSGIRKAEFAPLPPKGGCPSYCAALNWCWRGKQEGSF